MTRLGYWALGFSSSLFSIWWRPGHFTIDLCVWMAVYASVHLMLRRLAPADTDAD